MITTSREKIRKKIKVNKTAHIAKDVEIDVTGKVIIGPYVEIYDGVCIFTHKHLWNHSRGLRKDIEKIVPINLTIEKDVFIGKDAMILCVNKIGEGSIIGAGSVVTKDIPKFEVWAGNPARKIGVRKDG